LSYPLHPPGKPATLPQAGKMFGPPVGDDLSHAKDRGHGSANELNMCAAGYSAGAVGTIKVG